MGKDIGLLVNELTVAHSLQEILEGFSQLARLEKTKIKYGSLIYVLFCCCCRFYLIGLFILQGYLPV